MKFHFARMPIKRELSKRNSMRNVHQSGGA